MILTAVPTAHHASGGTITHVDENKVIYHTYTYTATVVQGKGKEKTLPLDTTL
jgi:hypothetical protein